MGFVDRPNDSLTLTLFVIVSYCCVKKKKKENEKRKKELLTLRVWFGNLSNIVMTSPFKNVSSKCAPSVWSTTVRASSKNSGEKGTEKEERKLGGLWVNDFSAS